MKIGAGLWVSIMLGLTVVSRVQAAGWSQAGDNPQSAGSILTIGGFPWLAIPIFVGAFFVQMYFRKHTPANKPTVNTCAPLIDEAKAEAERKEIEEEERQQRQLQKS